MLVALSTCCRAVLLLVLCESALGRLIARPRDVCINDDYLLSFVEYPSDTIPFCSMYEGLVDVTTTVVSITSRTTTINTATTTNTVVQTITIPAVTEYNTVTAIQMRKRGPLPTAAALAIRNLRARDNGPYNSAIISGVSSACSCLHLTPNTVTVPATAYSTRTENAIDYEKEIDIVSVTEGTSTVLVTLTPSSPSYSSAVPTPWNSTAIPSTPVSSDTAYSTSTPAATIITINPVSASIGTVIPTMNSSSEVPSSLPSESSTTEIITIPTSISTGTITPPLNTSYAPKTGLTTTLTTDLSSIVFPTSVTTPTSSSLPDNGTFISSSSLLTTSLLPDNGTSLLPSSLTVTSSPYEASSGIIPSSKATLHLTTLTLSLSSVSTILIPTSSSSASISGSPSSPPMNASSTASGLPIPIPTNATTTTAPAPLPTNATTASNYAPLPTNPSVGCPVINNTVITYSDQEFLVVCYTDYGGSITIGLDEPNFRACVQECAITNDGFSTARCRGITYFPNTSGPDCYLKTAAAILTPEYEPTAISAILINTTLPLNSSTSTSSTPVSAPSVGLSMSMNYSSIAGPTAPSTSGVSSFVPSISSNFSTTAGPTGSSSSMPNTTSAFTIPPITPSTSNYSSTASITPSLSFNSSSMASITPTASYNTSFTLNMSSTEYKTTPLPTYNASSCALPTSTEIVTSTSLSIIMSTQVVTVFAKLPGRRF